MKHNIIFSVLCVFLSCSFTPNNKQLSIKAPKTFIHSQVMDKDSVIQRYWWKSLQIDELDSLIERAVQNNLDIHLAISRVKQFEALFDISDGKKYPSVQMTNTTTRSYLPNPKGGDKLEQNQRSLNLGLMYTLDIWGKIASQTKAANADFLAMKYMMQQGYDQLIGHVAKYYFSIKASQEKLQLLQEAKRVYKENSELQNQRYKHGIGSELNMYLSEQQLASSEASIASENERLANYKYELSVLLGEYPSDDLISSGSLSFDQLLTQFNVPNSVPSKLLETKPELLHYKEKLEAARQNVGVAKADLFPQLSLSANLNLSATHFSDLFDFENTLTTQLIQSSSNTLFSGGSKRANVKQYIERYEQAFLSYKKSVLTAFKTTEALLLAKETRDKERKSMDVQHSYSEQIVKLREDQYLQGVGNYDDYINAQKSHYTLSTQVISTENLLIHTYIDLFTHVGNVL